MGAEPDLPPIRSDTAFDLASLTKLLCTTLLTASAVEQEKLQLDERPWAQWPSVTVRHALAHTGGILWWAPLYEAAIGAHNVGTEGARRALLAQALATPLQSPPGEKTRYSDVGFMALGALLEARLGDRLDRLFSDAAQDFYGETQLRFVSLAEAGYHPALPNVAHTERCPWRGRVLIGQVHDDNTFAMGGISGHAGLFGSVLDVLQAGRRLREALVGDAPGVPAQLRLFAGHPGERGLGFDRVSEGGTTGGALSANAVGHLGFTGTSLWIDPAPSGGVYVLLTNRVHPTRDNAAIGTLRPAFHRAAAAWVAAQVG